jgi:hypothetical protein
MIRLADGIVVEDREANRALGTANRETPRLDDAAVPGSRFPVPDSEVA